MSGIYAME